MYKAILFFALLIFLASFVQAAEELGKIVPLSGTPYFGGLLPRKIISESPLSDGDIIRTEKNSTGKAVYKDNSMISIMENSTVLFRKNMVKLTRGKTTLNFVKQSDTFRISTPNATIGLYGTSLELEIVKKITRIRVTEGKIWVRAETGNKKLIDLAQGFMVQVTDEGILENPIPVPAEHSGLIEPVPAVKPEIPEFVLDTSGNLETQGEYSYRIEPVLDGTFRILINGCAKLNGQDLAFRNKETVVLRGLEEGTYEFSLIANGIRNDFQVDLSARNNMDVLKIQYQRKILQFLILDLDSDACLEQLKKHVKFTMLYKGQRIPLTFHDKSGPHNFGFETSRFGNDSTCRSLITLPPEMDVYPDLLVHYTGDLPVKEKTQEINFKRNVKVYTIRFDNN